MSDYTALRAVSLTLRGLLEQFMTVSGTDILLKSPKEMKEDGDSGVSVWLYRVARDEHNLNQPPERVGPSLVRRQPMPVCLYYLITPMMTEPLDEQELLGRVLQVFNDHPVLRGGDLADTLAGSDVELHLFLESLTLEELTRVWGALQESYQASLSYMVHVVTIDSEITYSKGKVLQSSTTYSQIEEVA